MPNIKPVSNLRNDPEVLRDVAVANQFFNKNSRAMGRSLALAKTTKKALFIENEKGGIRNNERQKKYPISCHWRAALSSFETVAICLSSEDWGLHCYTGSGIFCVGDFALVASL